LFEPRRYGLALRFAPKIEDVNSRIWIARTLPSGSRIMTGYELWLEPNG
jgi:hypothetical protein